ncbi:MAG: ligase-associated DNA damage response endonuclease PdeM [Alphaproteobacteria bacterium]|nr:ligase-associated DNA damage response endonuclease PdeM [Alphaproteobacteria bacterium]
MVENSDHHPMLVNGTRLVPDPSGALWWPEARCLVLADLHLEKGSALARRGALLPPYDSRASLIRLDRLIARFEPARVICLGDTFHDPDASGRLGREEAARLAQMVAATEWHWILGNHDPRPPPGLGGAPSQVLRLGALIFRHEPASEAQAGEIAGHLHPKAAIRVRGRRLTGRAFLTDGMRLVMPAFGSYAGGLCALDPAFRSIFRHGFHAWIAGESRVVPVGSTRLEAFGAGAPILSSDRVHPGASRPGG